MKPTSPNPPLKYPDLVSVVGEFLSLQIKKQKGSLMSVTTKRVTRYLEEKRIKVCPTLLIHILTQEFKSAVNTIKKNGRCSKVIYDVEKLRNVLNGNGRVN